MTIKEICNYYGQDYDNVKHMTKFLTQLKNRYNNETKIIWQ